LREEECDPFQQLVLRIGTVPSLISGEHKQSRRFC
jgi:hypothetical protein